MTSDVALLERAFALARSGACASMAELAKALKNEKYSGVDAHLTGPSLRLQLRELMLRARRAPAPE